MRTLLRVPDLVAAVEPLVKSKVSADDIFRLIGSNEIKPFGVVQRMPIFNLDQIAEVASKLNAIHDNAQVESQKEVVK